MLRWPHAPVHWLMSPGLFMVTTGTYTKLHHLHSPERLDSFQNELFTLSAEFAWELHAWAILANHYHFVARSPVDATTLKLFLGKLHMTTAKALNQADGRPGRKVWFQFWDTLLTHQPSYLARLNYVHHNAVKHGLVAHAENYRWCSAAWFAEHAAPAFRATVESMPCDAVNVPDDF